MISKILVATDGSETAGKAVEYTAGLAKQLNANVRFLSVIDKSFFVIQTIPGAVTPNRILEPVEDYLKQTAETYIKEAEKLCKDKGIQSEGLIRSGHPVEEIIKEAEKSKVDLIVMGSHGKSAMTAAVLGSVAFGVVHKETKTPVLIVRK